MMYDFVEVFKDKTDSTSDLPLHINSCGKQNHINHDYIVTRPNGRVDYHFLYLLCGEIIAFCNGREYILKTGDLMLFKPKESQQYIFKKEPFTENYWIHFTGTSAKNVLCEAGLYDKSCYSTTDVSGISDIFSKLIREYSLKHHGYATACCGLFLQLATAISRSVYDNDIGGYADKRIDSIIEHINMHYSCPIDLDKYAAKCSLSKSRFVHLFKQHTGMPPARYQLSTRLDKAAYLLRHSDLSVSEISVAVGFDDPLYFSRLFKSKTGLSPREYRS